MKLIFEGRAAWVRDLTALVDRGIFFANIGSVDRPDGYTYYIVVGFTEDIVTRLEGSGDLYEDLDWQRIPRE